MKIALVIAILVSAAIGAFSIICTLRNYSKKIPNIIGTLLSILGIVVSAFGLLYVGEQVYNIRIDKVEGDVYAQVYSENVVFNQNNKIELAPVGFSFMNVKNKSNGTTWAKVINADPDDIVTIKMEYLNDTDSEVLDVVCDFTLPGVLEFIPGSMELYNGSHPAGVRLFGDDSGPINIGDYKPNATGVVTFDVRIKGDELGVGTNILRSWVTTYETSERVSQDFADIHVMLE